MYFFVSQRLAEFNRRLDKRPVESTNHKMMEDFKVTIQIIFASLISAC